MITLSLILMLAALICFLLGAFPINSRVNLVSLGLAFLTLAFLIGGHDIALH